MSVVVSSWRGRSGQHPNGRARRMNARTSRKERCEGLFCIRSACGHDPHMPIRDGETDRPVAIGAVDGAGPRDAAPRAPEPSDGRSDCCARPRWPRPAGAAAPATGASPGSALPWCATFSASTAAARGRRSRRTPRRPVSSRSKAPSRRWTTTARWLGSTPAGAPGGRGRGQSTRSSRRAGPQHLARAAARSAGRRASRGRHQRHALGRRSVAAVEQQPTRMPSHHRRRRALVIGRDG